MADELWITPKLRIPVALVQIRVSRSSGPGGQHANVTASRVEAVLDLTAQLPLSEDQHARLVARFGPRVSAVAQDSRSQARNRELALDRLAARIAGALATEPPRRPSRPTRASVERRLGAKRQRSERKANRRPPED